MKSLVKKIFGKEIVLAAFFVVFNGVVSADPVTIDVAKVRKEYEEKRDLVEKGKVLTRLIDLLERKLNAGKKFESPGPIVEAFKKASVKSRNELIRFSLAVEQDLLGHEEDLKRNAFLNTYLLFVNSALLSLGTYDDKDFLTFIGDDKAMKALAGPNYSHLVLSALCGAGVLAAGYFIWQKFFRKKEVEKDQEPEGALG